jgi:L-2-hydroxyglutarate oxidase LhgO
VGRQTLPLSADNAAMPASQPCSIAGDATSGTAPALPPETLDCVVIGAGVVGLAVARALAQAGREVVVLEAAEGIGTETSSRNSEVIHAGIYYPQGSWKARLCVSGREQLYSYCAERGVPHRRCGKLIVATDTAQEATLLQIQAKARANGVDNLCLLTRAQARALEPDVECTGALLSPSTGIVDSHAFMLALQGDAEHARATFAFHSAVRQGRVVDGGVELDVVETPEGLGAGAMPGTDAALRVRARTVVNCAGLHAPAVAARIAGPAATLAPRAHYAKGHYFTLAGRHGFTRLIYPVPVPGGLGVHLTLDLQGQARFGPDVQWVEEIDYSVDAARAEAFYAEVRRYWPGLADGALQPGYAGIRPKIAGPQAPNLDFRFDGPAQHGVPGLYHLFGIESPGLTSALAIGELLCERVAAAA